MVNKYKFELSKYCGETPTASEQTHFMADISVKWFPIVSSNWKISLRNIMYHIFSSMLDWDQLIILMQFDRKRVQTSSMFEQSFCATTQLPVVYRQIISTMIYLW